MSLLELIIDTSMLLLLVRLLLHSDDFDDEDE